MLFTVKVSKNNFKWFLFLLNNIYLDKDEILKDILITDFEILQFIH